MKKFVIALVALFMLASCGGSPKESTKDSTSAPISTTATFHVEWYNWDTTTLLYATDVEPGESAIYSGSTPYKPGTSEIRYDFIGFDKSTANVQKDIKTYAQFRTIYIGTEGLQLTLTEDQTAFNVTGYTGTDSTVQIPAKYRVDQVSQDSPLLDVIGISYAAFYNNKTITNVIIPSTVKTIGQSAFQSCSNLVSVSIKNTTDSPSNLTSIVAYSFAYCSSLTSFIVPKSVTSFAPGVTFMGCSSLNSLSFESGSTLGYEVVSGVVFKSSRTVLAYYLGGKTDISYTVPTSVRSIASGSFDGSRVKNLTVSEGVISIENAAFDGSAIESLSLPSTLTSIGHTIADGCSKLASITVSASNTTFVAVNNILYKIYSATAKELVLYANAKTDTTLEIGSDVITLYKNVLHSASKLTSIFVPTSVTTIEQYAFPNNAIIWLGWDDTATANPINFANMKSVENPQNTIRLYSETEPEKQPNDNGYRYWHLVDSVRTLWPDKSI